MNKDVILDKFYEKIKDDYPNLTKNDIKKIVITPFLHLRAEMKKETFPSVRVKNLGLFEVTLENAHRMLKHHKRKLEKKEFTTVMTEEVHLYYVELFQNYIEQCEQKKKSTSGTF